MIEVELFTRDHVVRGYAGTSGERLSDVLNDHKVSALYLERVQIARLHTLGREVPIQLMEASLEKSGLLFAVPIAKDLTEKSIFRRAARLSFQIMALLPGFEVQGHIHLTEKLDVNRVLLSRPEDFIPLTTATAVYMPNPQLTIHAQTIIINKKMVSLIGEQIPPETTGQTN